MEQLYFLKRDGNSIYVGTMRNDVDDLHKAFFIETKLGCQDSKITLGDTECNRIFFNRLRFLQDDQHIEQNANYEGWKLVNANAIALESKVLLDDLFQDTKRNIDNN